VTRNVRKKKDDIVLQTESEAWGLTDLEYRFAIEYDSGTRPMLSAFEAAFGDERQKISRSAMMMRASRAFHNKKVQAFLKHLDGRKMVLVERSQLKQKPPDSEDISNDRILSEEACIAFSNIKDLYAEDGSFIPITDLPDHVARAIREFEGVIIEGEDGKRLCLIKKLRFYDKGDSLQRLERISGMLKDTDVNVNVTLKALLVQIDGQSKGKLPAEVG
jgi:hypothetical protein